MFENRYEITRKLYADWARRPVLLSGRRRIPLLPVLVAVGCGVMLVRSVLDGRWGYGAMFALLLVLTVFRVLFYLPLMAARQHGRMLAQWGVESARVSVRDRGALDCVIRARVETAIRRGRGNG